VAAAVTTSRGGGGRDTPVGGTRGWRLDGVKQTLGLSNWRRLRGSFKEVMFNHVTMSVVRNWAITSNQNLCSRILIALGGGGGRGSVVG
jgi:hypothetical protein